MSDLSQAQPARKYAMIRLGVGDYLLPSNDAQTLWRLGTYREYGDAETADGRKITGTFWGVWKWDGGMPTIDQLAAALDEGEWARWDFWSGPHSTRSDAIRDALAVAR